MSYLVYHAGFSLRESLICMSLSNLGDGDIRSCQLKESAKRWVSAGDLGCPAQGAWQVHFPAMSMAISTLVLEWLCLSILRYK